MTWIRPSTKATGDKVGFNDLAEAVANVRELLFRHADGAGGVHFAENDTCTGSQIMRRLFHHQVEGLNGFNTVGTQTWPVAESHPFTIPSGYSGIWRLMVASASTMGFANQVNTAFWSVNSTWGSSGLTQISTGIDWVWTGKWAMGQAPHNLTGTRVVYGNIVDRFTSGDTIRIYSASRANYAVTTKWQFRSRWYMTFLGTTA